MAEFSFTSYFLTDSREISRIFGSKDTNIKMHVLTHSEVVDGSRKFHDGMSRINDGLDTIISSSSIENYDYNTALAIEMLYLAYGTGPESNFHIAVPSYPERFLPALRAMNLPTLFRATENLAWGEHVSLPIPVMNWDDTTGQFYFDSTSKKAALQELKAIGSLESAVAWVENTHPEVFDDIDPEDLNWVLEYFQSILREAEQAEKHIAVFRHGGI